MHENINKFFHHSEGIDGDWWVYNKNNCTHYTANASSRFQSTKTVVGQCLT